MLIFGCLDAVCTVLVMHYLCSRQHYDTADFAVNKKFHVVAVIVLLHVMFDVVYFASLRLHKLFVMCTHCTRIYLSQLYILYLA